MKHDVRMTPCCRSSGLAVFRRRGTCHYIN